MNPPHSEGDLILNDQLLGAIRDYWNDHIHDLEIATQPLGTPEFFQELDEYRFDKLCYLPRVVEGLISVVLLRPEPS